jgi:hypothetical protein
VVTDGGVATEGAIPPAPPEVTFDNRPMASDGRQLHATPTRTSDTVQRHLVRRRRRDTLVVLFGLLLVTTLIGFIPGASTAWVVTALSGIALAAYVAFLIHLRRMVEEREQKLHYLNPERAVRAPVAVSGRYAHPSNQAAAAR